MTVPARAAPALERGSAGGRPEDLAGIGWIPWGRGASPGARRRGSAGHCRRPASWSDLSTPLSYVQLAEGLRRDVATVDDGTLLDRHLGTYTDVIDAKLGRRPVHAIGSPSVGSSDLAARSLRQTVELAPAQPLSRILVARAWP